MDAKIDSWRLKMADLMLNCAVADAEQAAELVTRFVELLNASPISAGKAKPPLVSLPISSLQDANAAALAIAESLGGYLLSQGKGGPAMATVVLGPNGAECHGEGACPAMALIGALASAFAAEMRPPRTANMGQNRTASVN